MFAAKEEEKSGKFYTLQEAFLFTFEIVINHLKSKRQKSN